MIIVTFSDRSEAILEDGLVQYDDKVLPGHIAPVGGVWGVDGTPMAVYAGAAVMHVVNSYLADGLLPAVTVKAVR